MCFSDVNLGAKIDLTAFTETDPIKILFSENIGIVIQAKNDLIFEAAFKEIGRALFIPKPLITPLTSHQRFQVIRPN